MIEKLNVILVSLDAVRADHLGCYGYARQTSPNIDALAREGVLFEQAFAVSYWTLPSHASMLTGLQPAKHGADNRQYKISKKIKLLSESLKEKGFSTAGLVSNDFVSAFYGFDRGFDFFRNFAGERGQERAVKDPFNAKEMVSAALDWIEKQKQPFFLFLHIVDPHAPFSPPQEFRHFAGDCQQFETDTTQWGRFERDFQSLSQEHVDCLIGLYDGEIAFVDSQLGVLMQKLKTLNLLDDTLIIITADHGEQFRDHDGLGHENFWEEVIRVPLVFYCPRLIKSKKVGQLVRHIDIVPSVMDYLGYSSAGLDGVSLKSAIEQETDLGLQLLCEVRPIPFQFKDYDFCVRTSKWKYFERRNILLPRVTRWNRTGINFFFQDLRSLWQRFLRKGFGLKQRALFDLKNDPLEKENLLKKKPEVAAELKETAQKYYAGLRQRTEKVSEKIDEGTDEAKAVEKRLEALGYID
jgi:arylsulfatase A-like enzyme